MNDDSVDLPRGLPIRLEKKWNVDNGCANNGCANNGCAKSIYEAAWWCDKPRSRFPSRFLPLSPIRGEGAGG